MEPPRRLTDRPRARESRAVMVRGHDVVARAWFSPAANLPPTTTRMRPHLLPWIGLAAFGLSAAAAEAAPRDPSGLWLVEDRRARVRVETCGAGQDRVCAYIVWLRPGGSAPRTDAKNPDPKKNRRPILGHQIMLGLKPNGDDQYEGLIYNAEDGRSYDVTVWLERPGDLKVKGCLVGFLCSTQSWTAVSDVAPGQLTAATGAPGGPTPDPEWAGRPDETSRSPPRRDPRPRP